MKNLYIININQIYIYIFYLFYPATTSSKAIDALFFCSSFPSTLSISISFGSSTSALLISASKFIFMSIYGYFRQLLSSADILDLL